MALDTNEVLEIGFGINGADIVVTSLAIKREECVTSSVTDQAPFLAYEDLCSDVCKAFPDLALLIDSIESVLATTIAEDLEKADNDGNLLDPDSYANCIHIPIWMNTLHLRTRFSSTALCLKSCFNFLTSRALQLLASPFMTCSLVNVMMLC